MQPRLYAGIMPHTAVRTNNPIGKVVTIPALCNTLLGEGNGVAKKNEARHG